MGQSAQTHHLCVVCGAPWGAAVCRASVGTPVGRGVPATRRWLLQRRRGGRCSLSHHHHIERCQRALQDGCRVYGSSSAPGLLHGCMGPDSSKQTRKESSTARALALGALRVVSDFRLPGPQHGVFCGLYSFARSCLPLCAPYFSTTKTFLKILARTICRPEHDLSPPALRFEKKSKMRNTLFSIFISQIDPGFELALPRSIQKSKLYRNRTRIDDFFLKRGWA
jgi:hypothetical protein